MSPSAGKAPVFEECRSSHWLLGYFGKELAVAQPLLVDPCSTLLAVHQLMLAASHSEGREKYWNANLIITFFFHGGGGVCKL